MLMVMFPPACPVPPRSVALTLFQEQGMNQYEVVEGDASAVDSKRAYRIYDWGLRVIPQGLQMLNALTDITRWTPRS